MADPVTVSLVVEGHGEVVALPVLLRRLVPHLRPGTHATIPRPFRQHRSRLVRPGELERAVELAGYRVEGPGGVLVLIDADDDCPAELGPRLQSRTDSVGSVPGVVVVANREYEAWFLAAASSLAGVRGLLDTLQDHRAAEDVRNAKGWMDERIGGSGTYSPTVDQAAFSAALDLALARRRSRSFRKLCDALEHLVDAGRSRSRGLGNSGE